MWECWESFKLKDLGNRTAVLSFFDMCSLRVKSEGNSQALALHLSNSPLTHFSLPSAKAYLALIVAMILLLESSNPNRYYRFFRGERNKQSHGEGKEASSGKETNYRTVEKRVHERKRRA